MRCEYLSKENISLRDFDYRIKKSNFPEKKNKKAGILSLPS